MPASRGQGRVLGGSTEDMVEKYFLFLVLYGQYPWWGKVGRFLPTVMAVERGNATSALGLFSQFCYNVLCVR
jgi:hypothetical protein